MVLGLWGLRAAGAEGRLRGLTKMTMEWYELHKGKHVLM
jgi:hypothetical protein